jgi:hypothetical protein
MRYPYSKYGPKLDDSLSLYRLGIGAVTHVIEGPCKHKIKATINLLQDPKSVDCGTFETMLVMEHSPLCESLNLLVSNFKVFPSCIRLLLVYCTEGRGVSTYIHNKSNK